MNLPLQGIRVLDLSWVLAGPIATSMLASLGAEVIKIESRERPDQTRESGPKEGDDRLDRARMFNTVNYSKKSLALNMKHPAAADVFYDLLGHCDVVVENYATGALDRMGLSIEKIREVNPAVIIASSSGFGREGPLSSYVAYGNNLHAASGLTSLIHYDPDVPLGLLGVWSDPVAAYSLVFGIIGALLRRGTGGSGARLDLSMLEASAAMLTSCIVGEQVAQSDGEGDSVQECFRCAGEGDEWIAISIPDDLTFAGLCRAIGDFELANDRRFATPNDRSKHWPSLDAAIAAWCASLTREEVASRLAVHGVPYGESRTPREVIADPHLSNRGFLVWRNHPLAGFKPVLRPPWMRSAGFDIRRAPLLGEDTLNVLHDLMGYSREHIESLNQQHPGLFY